MTFGRNPNSVPYGGVGRTNVPLPGSKPVDKVVKASPVLVRNAGVADGEDTTSDYGSVDPNYMEDGTAEQSDGLFGGMTRNVAQPGEEQIDLINGDSDTADPIIYGTDDGESGNGISDDDIYGSDSSADNEMSEEEWDKIIEGDDSLDATINGVDDGDDGTGEMSAEEFDEIVFGKSDEPDETPKTKKVIYRASGVKQRNTSHPTNTGMGMTQQEY